MCRSSKPLEPVAKVLFNFRPLITTSPKTLLLIDCHWSIKTRHQQSALSKSPPWSWRMSPQQKREFLNITYAIGDLPGKGCFPPILPELPDGAPAPNLPSNFDKRAQNKQQSTTASAHDASKLIATFPTLSEGADVDIERTRGCYKALFLPVW